MLTSITSFIVGAIMAIGGWLGITNNTTVEPVVQNTPQEEALGGFSPVAGSTYRLKASIGTTDTSIILSSFTEPITGNPMTMTTINSDIGYATIDPQSSNRKEFISFTGVTQNSDGSATLTGVSRGLGFQSPYTASTTLRKAHPGQSLLILSDSPQLFNEYARKRSDETISGTWTFPATTAASSSGAIITKGYFDATAIRITDDQTAAGNKTFSGNFAVGGTLGVTGTSTLATSSVTSLSTASGTITKTPTTDLDIANKAYVDGVALSGAPDASDTVKGVVEEATLAEYVAGTDTGGTGARLFVTPSLLSQHTPIVTTFSTTTSTYVATSTDMDENDILMVWGSWNANAPSENCAVAALTSLTLQKKSSTRSASTTEQVISGGAGSGCSMSAFFTHTATTTETISVSATGVENWSNIVPVLSLMTQLIKR